MFFQKINSLYVGRFAPLFGRHGIDHAFSTRKGGASRSPFDTLNLGGSTTDSPDAVYKNRRCFFQALDVRQTDVAIPEQVHAGHVVVVTHPGRFPETDGLVTNKPGVVLTIQVADCLPVYLYDPNKQALGLVHAGWRGSALQIAAKAVRLMQTEYGSRPADLIACLGPSIGPCCYEVGEDVSQHFSSKHFIRNRLDLLSVNSGQLIDSGLQLKNITESRLCTACHAAWFYSYRREKGQTGRMMAVLGLKAEKT